MIQHSSLHRLSVKYINTFLEFKIQSSVCAIFCSLKILPLVTGVAVEVSSAVMQLCGNYAYRYEIRDARSSFGWRETHNNNNKDNSNNIKMPTNQDVG
jgi:hypothetical protein